MPNDDQNLIKLKAHIAENIPGFEVKAKNESKFVKFLSYLLFFNKGFMTRYITTLYPRIFIPTLAWEDKNTLSTVIVYAHEYVHLKDRHLMGWLFNYLYLTPQLYSLFALLAIFASNWWLLSLLFLLPLPSPGRMWLELRGYTMSMAVTHWYGYTVSPSHYVNYFTESGYYWMFPSKKIMEWLLWREYEKICADELSPLLQEVKDVLFPEK